MASSVSVQTSPWGDPLRFCHYPRTSPFWSGLLSPTTGVEAPFLLGILGPECSLVFSSPLPTLSRIPWWTERLGLGHVCLGRPITVLGNRVTIPCQMCRAIVPRYFLFGRFPHALSRPLRILPYARIELIDRCDFLVGNARGCSGEAETFFPVPWGSSHRNGPVGDCRSFVSDLYRRLARAHEWGSQSAWRSA